MDSGAVTGCPYCEKTFKAKGLLKPHIRKVHENAKKKCQKKKEIYSCSQCAAHFTMKQNLTRHMKTTDHSLPYIHQFVFDIDEKMYMCKVCNDGQRYKSHQFMINHLKTHGLVEKRRNRVYTRILKTKLPIAVFDETLPIWIRTDCGSFGQQTLNQDNKASSILGCSQRLSLLNSEMSVSQIQLPLPLDVPLFPETSSKPFDPISTAELIDFDVDIICKSQTSDRFKKTEEVTMKRRNCLAVSCQLAAVTVLSATVVKPFHSVIRVTVFQEELSEVNVRWSTTLEINAEVTEVKNTIPSCWIASTTVGIFWITKLGTYLQSTTIYESAEFKPKFLEVNPYMNDEIMFLDGENRLRWGSCVEDEKWHKIRKLKETLIDATWSNHPRRVYFATEKAIFLQNLDVKRFENNEIFAVSEEEKIEKLDRFFCDSFHILLATDRRVLILTSTGHVVYSIHHSSLIGPSLMVTSGPLSSTSGRLNPVFLYSLFLNELHCIPFMEKESFWCTTDSIFRLRDPTESLDSAPIQKDFASFWRVSSSVLTGIATWCNKDWITVARLTDSGDIFLEKIGFHAKKLEQNKKKSWKKYIKRVQDVSSESSRSTTVNLTGALEKFGVSSDLCGFRGSFTTSKCDTNAKVCPYEGGHLAMTYSALNCLLILGDDLSRVDTNAILRGVQACQLENGSFCAHPGGSENDMRFVYCATAINVILSDRATFDVQKTCEFITKCSNYDGGFGQCPGLESHGGSTFCAIASLELLNKLWDNSVLSMKRMNKLVDWCVNRQELGFHGRAHKADDSCYTFWVGSTLAILKRLDFVDADKLRDFTLSTQDDRCGGFGKYPDGFPDVLHTYFSLSGLSLLNEPGLNRVDPALNITLRSANNLKNIERKSSKQPVKNGI